MTKTMERYIAAIAAWLKQLDNVNTISLSDTCESLEDARYKLSLLEQEKIVAERILLQSCRDIAVKQVDG